MRSALILLFVAGLSFAAPVPKGVKKPPSADGVWECVEYNLDGRAEEVPFHLRYYKVAGEHMSYGCETLDELAKQMPETNAYTFRISDPDRPTLRTMVDSDGIVHSAVVELDADTLRWTACADAERTITECKPGLGVQYFVFKRVNEK